MKKIFIATLVVIILFLETGPVFAQDYTPPEGEGWECKEKNVPRGTVLIITGEEPVPQVWVNGIIFLQDIPEEEAVCWRVVGLGTLEVRVEPKCEDITKICRFMPTTTTSTVVPATAVTSATTNATVLAATETSIIESESLTAMATSATMSNIAPTARVTPTIIVIALVSMALALVVVFTIIKRKKQV